MASLTKTLFVDTTADKLAYDFKSAAAAISVSPRSIARAIARGQLHPSKAYRKKLILRSELIRFLEDTSR